MARKKRKFIQTSEKKEAKVAAAEKDNPFDLRGVKEWLSEPISALLLLHMFVSYIHP